jgi:hypothetical protein
MNAIVLDTPEQIRLASLAALIMAYEMEVKSGMKLTRNVPTLTRARQVYGIDARTKAAAVTQLKELREVWMRRLGLGLRYEVGLEEPGYMTWTVDGTPVKVSEAGVSFSTRVQAKYVDMWGWMSAEAWDDEFGGELPHSELVRLTDERAYRAVTVDAKTGKEVR